MEGKPRCLLSVSEMPSGDLILNLYLKELDGSIPAPFSNVIPEGGRGEPILEYRYTIHTSPNSTDNANTIKLHRILESGPTEPVYSRTSAIRSGSMFEPLYVRMCSALEGPGYDLKSGRGAIENLGLIKAPFTLVFAVLVGPPHKKFRCPVSGGKHRRLQFRNFCLHILWSYLTLPPTNHGRIYHLSRPGVSPGFNAIEAAQIFDNRRLTFKEFVVNMFKNYTLFDEHRWLLENATYVPEADLGSVHVDHWVSMVQALGVNIPDKK